MSEKKSGFKWLDKLKKIKHIEIYISIIFIVILLLIYLSNFSSKANNDQNKTTNTNELTVTEYISNMENNLKGILSNIGGVSNVNVMITLDMSSATVIDSKISLANFPPIKGVIVVAKGVGDTATKLKVLHAIEAVIDITSGSIEILSS